MKPCVLQLICATFACLTSYTADANKIANKLFEDLLNSYNRLQRPIDNPLDIISIKMSLRLSQIIDVHEKDQIMTSSVWLEQEWYDPKLKWNTSLYGGVSVLYIPSEMIWVPDIVLYNNADSYYNITIATKASVFSDGKVVWNPPAVYKSLCQIDVEWFPFDLQNCLLKFGSWTFTTKFLDLNHKSLDRAKSLTEFDAKGREVNVSLLEPGIDICDYYPSVEWDILEIPARRHNIMYMSCCPNQSSYADITYYIELRRKPLFYTVNLIFPCVGISFLTILVFYLPSDSGEKITLCISILVSLTVFFLLLTEIIPATSIVLPLIGKYLLFTMVMVTLSVIVTVITLNIHFRTPTTHKMPPWVKTLFLKILPNVMFMRRPLAHDEESFRRVSTRSYTSDIAPVFEMQYCFTRKLATSVCKSRSADVWKLKTDTDNKQIHPPLESDTPPETKKLIHAPHLDSIYRTPEVLRAFNNVCFIADLMKKQDKDDKVDEDWKYVAMVLDRLFLWIFAITCFFGTTIILLTAPSFYDPRVPMGVPESCNKL